MGRLGAHGTKERIRGQAEELILDSIQLLKASKSLVGGFLPSRDALILPPLFELLTPRRKPFFLVGKGLLELLFQLVDIDLGPKSRRYTTFGPRPGAESLRGSPAGSSPDPPNTPWPLNDSKSFSQAAV